MKTRDKNYKVVEVGMHVEVPEPDTNNDNWNFSFVGYVETIDLQGYLTVIDGEGDAFMVESERVEIVD